MNRRLAPIHFALVVLMCCLAGAARALDPGPLVSPAQIWSSYDLSQGESYGWASPEFDFNPNPAAWGSGRTLVTTQIRPAVSRSNLWNPQGGVSFLSLMNSNRVHYFRTTFTLSNDTFAPALQVVHLLGDGAVFRLNGQEIGRWNMPEGPVAPDTRALPLERPLDAHAFAAPADALLPGTNVFSVAVYSSTDSAQSPATCFGARLDIIPNDYLFLGENLTNQVRFEGESLHLRPTVVSTFPFTTQWYFNGEPVATANPGTLDIPFLTSSNGGTYRLVVNTSQGRSITNSFGLTLLSPNILGSFDPSFVSASVAPVIRACVVLPDDRIVVGTTSGLLTRLNADGTPDPTFHPPSSLVGVYSLLAQSDGSLIVGGNFSARLGTNNNIGVMKLLADGTPVTNFVVQTDGQRVHSLAAGPEGKIYIGGEFSTVNRKRVPGFGRLNPNGSVDTNFAPRIDAASGRAIVVQPDGKVLATVFPGLLSRFNVDGSIDTTFAPQLGASGSTRYSDFVGALALDDDLNVYAGGVFRTLGDVSRTNVVRIKPNGQIDPTFDAGTAQDFYAYKMVPLTDGTVLFLSDLARFNQQLAGGVARLRHDGSVDTNFVLGTALFENSTVPSQTGPPAVYAVGFQRDGRMILAGNFQSYLGNKLSNLVRIFMPLPGPKLRVDHASGSEFLISWPIAGGAGELESISTINGVPWSAVTSEAAAIGWRWFVRQSSSPPDARFFRHVR